MLFYWKNVSFYYLIGKDLQWLSTAGSQPNPRNVSLTRN